jgi:hypothetical protein
MKVLLVLLLISNSVFGAVYYYAYGRSYDTGAFHFKDTTRAWTHAEISAAFSELSNASGLKFRPWSGSGAYHIVIDFVASSDLAWSRYYNGRSYFTISNTRNINKSQRIARTVVQHESFHYPLRYRANPPADQWYHSTDRNCVFNINATAPGLCPAEISWLKSRFGNP